MIVALLVVAGLFAFSNSFGRAEPTGNYRPPMPPLPLETGCYPLPDGVELDFSHQVRRDGDLEVDGETRRRLIVQWNLVDLETAADAVLAAFTEAGFTQVSRSAREATVTRPDTGPVSWTLTPFDVDDEVVVRGRITFDLPAIEVQSDDPICSVPSATKRFGSRHL